ncbi:MAG: DUF401 family protein [Thermoanaerobacterales bacterium]|nr:DUF401 family protein [Thermoanaerobacterales bacterium]
MREFAAVIISFSVIPILIKRKMPIGIAICICAGSMALLSGLTMGSILGVIVDIFTDFNKLQQFIVILEVGILGRLLGRYKIIDRVIQYLTRIVRSNRIILMFIPALVGFLQVPGGAIISAPFVDRLGGEANITKSKRAIINVVFRHISMHIMPYSIGFLLIASIAPEISIYKIIGLNSIFVVFYVIMSYFFYIQEVELVKGPPQIDVLPNLINLLKYTAPVYASVLLNLIFGVPFYIGMLVNILIVYLLNPSKKFGLDMLRSVNVNVLYSLFGVLIIQGIVRQMDSLTAFFSLVFSNPNTILIGIAGASLFFDFITGYRATSIGVVVPLLLTLPISENRLLLYTHMTFVWGFLGYFFSPLHLCQLFTCDFLGIAVHDLYKHYYKFFFSLVGFLVLTYFLLGIWLV